MRRLIGWRDWGLGGQALWVVVTLTICAALAFVANQLTDLPDATRNALSAASIVVGVVAVVVWFCAYEAWRKRLALAREDGDSLAGD